MFDSAKALRIVAFMALAMAMLYACILGIMMIFIRGHEHATQMRVTEYKDAIQSYAESVSIDNLELALDTSWRKQNVNRITNNSTRITAQNRIIEQIKEAYNNNYVKIQTIDVEIGAGQYSESGGVYTQSDEQRPYVKGTMLVKYPIYAADRNGLFTNMKATQDEFFTQTITWHIYANRIHNDVVQHTNSAMRANN